MDINYHFKRIHIRPEDYIAKFMDWDDSSPCYVLHYIEPYGPYEHNEMSDTIYNEGDVVPYHEHERGVEVFLVDRGRAECWIRGKRAVVEKGDMVVITPNVSHGFRFLEDNTIWRELFQEIQMNEGILQLNRVREYRPETAKNPEFNKSVFKRDGNLFFEYQPVFRDVDKSEIPQIRPYDYAVDRFDFDGISLLQKVTRHETNGNKEIWQMRMKKGYNLSWNEWNPHVNLFVVYSGSVDVKLDGGDEFVAKERDILHIPSYLAGELTTREDTVLLDFNCRGYLFRALDEIQSLSVTNPKAYQDQKVLDEIFERCDYFIKWKKL
ncbi:MAG: cupin domain-containing protein [Desulfitobacteriia bacterium]|jgi:quercetin dioxygenase-like cupin family protein